MEPQNSETSSEGPPLLVTDSDSPRPAEVKEVSPSPSDDEGEYFWERIAAMSVSDVGGVHVGAVVRFIGMQNERWLNGRVGSVQKWCANDKLWVVRCRGKFYSAPSKHLKLLRNRPLQRK